MSIGTRMLAVEAKLQALIATATDRVGTIETKFGVIESRLVCTCNHSIDRHLTEGFACTQCSCSAYTAKGW